MGTAGGAEEDEVGDGGGGRAVDGAARGEPVANVEREPVHRAIASRRARGGRRQGDAVSGVRILGSRFEAIHGYDWTRADEPVADERGAKLHVPAVFGVRALAQAR